ncbi:hypothetical protein [Pararhizobium sp.]|uniref:hypothetical protein n=1 Tax=Pararhizobium sp. TaxID=1977563 RepID=UPI003D149BE9
MSGYDEIQTAAVIRYPYLWSREARKGETEGRKDRPVAVGVRIPRADGDLAMFFPHTTKQPEADRLTVEYQRSKNAGRALSVNLRLWITSTSSMATSSDVRST